LAQEPFSPVILGHLLNVAETLEELSVVAIVKRHLQKYRKLRPDTCLGSAVISRFVTSYFSRDMRSKPKNPDAKPGQGFECLTSLGCSKIKKIYLFYKNVLARRLLLRVLVLERIFCSD
jgi:hypothetical protein